MTKSHEPGDLKQQAFILSQFWKLEVWKEGVAWVAKNTGVECHYLLHTPSSSLFETISQ